MNAPSTPNAVTSPIEQPQKSGIDRLFSQFAATYGANFADKWAGVDPDTMKATWIAGLRDLDPDEIQRGMQGCFTRKWAPNLPEFRQMCRPELDLETLFHRAVTEMGKRRRGEPENWPTWQVFWAAQRLGNDLLQLSYPKLQKRWEAAWLEAAQDQGKPIPERSGPALPAPGHTTLTREEAAKRASELGAAIGSGRRSRQWAFDIAEGTRQHANRYSVCQIDMAARALLAFGEDLNQWPVLADAIGREAQAA